jgi:hypothetical protein
MGMEKGTDMGVENSPFMGGTYMVLSMYLVPLKGERRKEFTISFFPGVKFCLPFSL